RSDGRGRTTVRILDNQRYWSFFKAYVICYVSLVGLYIVIDAFSNLDEFSKRAEGAVEMFQIMSRFYLIHQSQFFDQLCGVIGMMLHGKYADRATRTLFPCYATIGVRIFGSIREIEGQQATYIPLGHPTAPLTGGWLVREATINPPLDDEMLRGSGEILSRVD